MYVTYFVNAVNNQLSLNLRKMCRSPAAPTPLPKNHCVYGKRNVHVEETSASLETQSFSIAS